MKTLIAGVCLLVLFGACSLKTETASDNERNQIEIRTKEENILGVWTDGSGPNASVRIEEDSIYDVEHFGRVKYVVKNDSLIIFYDDGPFGARIRKLDEDSLVYESGYGLTKMGRFNE